MSADQNLPNIRVGRDAEREDGESGDGATVEYLNYEVLERFGWSLSDDDLFERASAEDLPAMDHGTFEAGENRYILDAAEDAGYDWPFECRAASCANCAAILREGDVEMDMDLILTEDEVEDRGIVLTCQSLVKSDEARIIYNAKHLDYLQDRVIGVREV